MEKVLLLLSLKILNYLLFLFYKFNQIRQSLLVPYQPRTAKQSTKQVTRRLVLLGYCLVTLLGFLEAPRNH